MYQGLAVMVQAAAAALHRLSRGSKDTIPVGVIEQLLSRKELMLRIYGSLSYEK